MINVFQLPIYRVPILSILYNISVFFFKLVKIKNFNNQCALSSSSVFKIPVSSGYPWGIISPVWQSPSAAEVYTWYTRGIVYSRSKIIV